MKIAVLSDRAPFGYLDDDGNYKGYDITFAERIGQDLGVTVTYVPVDLSDRIAVVQDGRADILLANFTVTEERAQQVNFALPYMKVSLGVVSPDTALITDVSQLKGKTLIVVNGTTAESWFEKNEPDVTLKKYDEYADAFSALQNGEGDALSTDNTGVLAWALSVSGYTVGITTLGSTDQIAPAVAKGNTTVLDWLNSEIKALGDEQFFHKDYEENLAPVYGSAAKADDLVVEGGNID